MTLVELIEYSKLKEKDIRLQHKIIYDFHVTNPWVLNNKIIELKANNSPVKGFEELIEFKEKYFINNLSKIYQQISLHNPLLLKDNYSKFIFYRIEEGLYDEQKKNNLEKGEYDSLGKLVTGSDLILEVCEVELDDFLELYYTSQN